MKETVWTLILHLTRRQNQKLNILSTLNKDMYQLINYISLIFNNLRAFCEVWFYMFIWLTVMIWFSVFLLILLATFLIRAPSSVCFSVKSEEGRRTIKVGILSKVLEISKMLLLIYRHLKYASHTLYTIKTKITQMTYRSTKMTEKGYQVRI